MSQDSGASALSIVRSVAIFTAFAFAFYFLLVWNPVGTLGDVRHYLEHRVRVPVEWIAVVFPVAWIIQRHSGYTAAAAFLVPIFVLILALTKPNYGAEFWSIFRHEIHLNPIYVPRGLLVCFFLLSLILSLRLGWRDNDRARTFLLCLLIGFAVTSWEALITPAPPRFFRGGLGPQYEGPWAQVVWTGWVIISRFISQYVPPDYWNAVFTGVTVYPFLAAFLLLFPGYRNLPRDYVRDHQDELRTELPLWLVVGVFLGLSGWAFWAVTQQSTLGGGTKFLLWVLSIPAVLAMIAIFLSSIIWIPAGLLLLPAFLFWALSQPFKVVYFLVVKGPVKVLHGLHYLMVPHPLEEVIKKYEEVRARDGAKIDYASFAEKMARGRYNWVRDGIPAWWKSRNWEKRLKKIMALRGRVRAEKDVGDKYTEEFRKDHRD